VCYLLHEKRNVDARHPHGRTANGHTFSATMEQICITNVHVDDISGCLVFENMNIAAGTRLTKNGVTFTRPPGSCVWTVDVQEPFLGEAVLRPGMPHFDFVRTPAGVRTRVTKEAPPPSYSDRPVDGCALVHPAGTRPDMSAVSYVGTIGSKDNPILARVLECVPGSVVYAERCKIKGHHLIIYGSNNYARGDDCKVKGDWNRVIGDDNYIVGVECSVAGDHNEVESKEAFRLLIGDKNKITCSKLLSGVGDMNEVSAVKSREEEPAPEPASVVVETEELARLEMANLVLD